jgi:hypothetical protein
LHSDLEARPWTGVECPFERLSATGLIGEVNTWRDRTERAEIAADFERKRADHVGKRVDADRRVGVVMIDGFAARADLAEQATAAERVPRRRGQGPA